MYDYLILVTVGHEITNRLQRRISRATREIGT